MGYNNKDINNAIQRARSGTTRITTDSSSTKKSYLPYIQGVTDKMAKLFAKKDIRASFKPIMAIRKRMKSIKDDPDHLQQKGVYKVNCSCGECYIGETCRTFKIRLKNIVLILGLENQNLSFGRTLQ